MKPILDMCYGSRMFYFDEQTNHTLFNEIKAEEHILYDGRALRIIPDISSVLKNLFSLHI